MGSAREGFEHLDEHGYIHEDKAAYLDQAAEDFVRLTNDGKRPLDCIAVSPTNRECDQLTEKSRQKMKAAGRIGNDAANLVESFRSWGWTKPQLGNIENYQIGTKIFFNTGRAVKPSQIRNSIDVGNAVPLPVGKGDIVRFTVNLRTPDCKINNGSLAIATGNRNEYLLLDSNRRELTTIRLPEEFRGVKYGWVMTSHASQGMTSKNVVVAAEKMSKQAFYVGCSRGKFQLALHVPEKEYFKQKLMAIRTERLSVHDLLASGEIETIPGRKSAEQITRECRPDPHQLVRACRLEKLRNFLRKITRRTGAAAAKMLLLWGDYRNRQTDAGFREQKEMERQFQEKHETEGKHEKRNEERRMARPRRKPGRGMGFD